MGDSSQHPLGFFPSSGWSRSQAWSTPSLPLLRPAACLPEPLPGLVPHGNPSIAPANWMQRAMAPLKRQMSLRLESEGPPSVACTLFPPCSCCPHQTSPASLCRPLLERNANNSPAATRSVIPEIPNLCSQLLTTC